MANWNLHAYYFTKGVMLVNRINKIGIRLE